MKLMKPASFFTLFLLVFGSIVLHGQTEIVIDKKNLSFNSPFEEQQFEKHFKDETDMFMLLMAEASTAGTPEIQKVRDRFYNHLKSINTEKLSSKKNEKKIKFIYDNIHDTFFKKYQIINHFKEIFSEGYYNCVSATALYALAFDYFNIPYSIREKPTHVYLIAYPNQERIVVESTDPMHGYFSINPEFKQNFVKSLKEQKIISHSEYTAGDFNSLFDKYYFNDEENISLVNLLGIQYMNDALYKMNEEKATEAFKQIEKAYVLFPSERTAFMLTTIGIEAFHQHKTRDNDHAKYIALLSNYGNKHGVTSDMIEGEFAQVINDLLFEKGKKEDLNSYYNALLLHIADEQLKQELSFIYNYEYGRYHYNQAKYKEALPFFEKCLSSKPQDQNTINILISSLAINLSTNNDNLFIIKSLEDYSIRFPSLNENNKFSSMLATCYVIQFGMEYELGRPPQGDQFRSLFEKYMTEHDDISVSHQMIGQAYSIAAVYFFRKGQTAKAKKTIETGLQYAPNNFELITRKKMIN